MDDTEDNTRYPPYPYGVNHQQGYGSLNRQKLPVRSGLYSHEVANHYAEDDIDDEDEDEEQLDEEEDDDGDPSNSNQLMHKDVDEDEIDDDDNDNDNDNDDDDDNENDDDNDTQQKNYTKGTEYADLERHPKKRKLKSLVSSYEFARRVPAPAPSAAAPSASNPSFGGRNALTDWSERETIVLLDSWGDRFLQHGRKSLRSEEWQEVAEKVSGVSKIERTDTQCRNRLDTLKKKYKKEKIKLAEIGGGSGTSKWVYFKKMDKLMSSPPQQVGLSCGLDSGEYVFLNPRVYINRANGLDEMRDSPGNSESTGQEDGSDGLPPKKRRYGRENDEGSSFSLLADSIKKFTEIYEKIEHNKRLQMVELEKMRMDFHRDLEMQKRQILERAHAEIAKLRQAGDVENDDSAENASG